MKRGLIRNIKLAGMWAIMLPGTLVVYIIAWLDRYLGFPLTFPKDVDGLAKKKKWLIKQLKKNSVIPDTASVNHYRVTPLTQEHIFRSNACTVEISYTHNDQQEALKCFAKFAPTMGTIWNRTIFNLQMNHLKEIYFNDEFVRDQCVASPEVYVAKVGALTGNLCLVTEFMEDCIEYPVPDKFISDHFEQALNGMASLHACYWKDRSKRMRKVFPIVEATVDMFDSMVAGKWSIPARKILVQSWNRMNEPETVLHGDARVGNMMFPKEEGKGRFVFFDWQAVRKGKAVFDLAYFLVLSLDPAYRRSVENEALKNYYDILVDKGVKDYSLEELMEDYQHACLSLVILLSLPMLSGEASVEGEGAVIFAWGMNIWRLRLLDKFEDFDYEWLANHYDITEQEGRDAIVEMLDVIYNRLKRVTGNRDFENL